MTALPAALRRLLGLLCLALPAGLIFAPLPLLRFAVLAALGLLVVLLILLPAAGLQEDLAWTVLFTCLAPVAWASPNPGRWWTDLARRSEDTRLIEGALDRGEAWGSDEAAFEIALNRLSSGVQGLQQGGVARLKPLAALGHRDALEALAGCMAWGQGTALDAVAARTLWIRLGGRSEEPIPAPRPGLLRQVAARPDSPTESRLAAGLERAGEATRGLLSRSAPARAGLWICAGGVFLFLLAIPLTFLLSNLALGGAVGAATRLILFAMAVVAAPALLVVGFVGLEQWRSTRMGGAAQRLRARAEAGDADACFALGEAYDQGAHHAAQDRSEARRWYRAAAEQGHAEAAFRLGEMLLHGIGGMKERPQALTWLRQAAEAGHPIAAQRLAEAQPSEDP